MTDDRPATDPTADEGGDPACWAHLFLDEDDDTQADPEGAADGEPDGEPDDEPDRPVDRRPGAALGDPGDGPLDPGRTSRVGPR